MKKVLATILALVMALSVTTAAWADGTALPEAVNGVITLTENVVINSTDLTITSGAATVIDLNGHDLKIVYAANATSIMYAGENTVLTFKDSTATSEKLGGTLKLTGDRFAGNGGANAAINTGAGAVLNIDGIVVECDGSAFYPQGEAAEVNINNSSVTAGVYCVGTNSSSIENGGVKITLTYSDFISNSEDSDNCPVMINVGGKLVMNGCYVMGGRQGVIVRAGEAEITDTIIELNATVQHPDYSSNNWGSGNNLPSAAIVVGNKTISKTGYKADAKLTLTNSAVFGNGSVAIYADGNNDHQSEVKIDGAGTYVGGEVTKGSNAEKADITIVSGEFTDANAVSFAVADAARATMTYGEDNSSTLLIGADAIALTAVYAESGDTITVQQGDVNLRDVPVGVTVANNGSGTVTVNGSGAITEGHPYTVPQPPRYYYNSTTTTTTDTKADGTKGSPKTFDAGVGIYAVSAILSVTGMAYVGKRKF